MSTMYMSKLTIIHTTLCPSTYWLIIIMDIIVGTSLDQYGIFYKKFLIHSASSIALSRVINSDFIINPVIYIFLEDFHDRTTPLSVNTYPPVDFEFLVLDI